MDDGTTRATRADAPERAQIEQGQPRSLASLLAEIKGREQELRDEKARLVERRKRDRLRIREINEALRAVAPRTSTKRKRSRRSSKQTPPDVRPAVIRSLIEKPKSKEGHCTRVSELVQRSVPLGQVWPQLFWLLGRGEVAAVGVCEDGKLYGLVDPAAEVVGGLERKDLLPVSAEERREIGKKIIDSIRSAAPGPEDFQ